MDFGQLFLVAALLDDLSVPWVFSGGWAIDLFLGRVTREHKDIDIAVRRADQLAVQAYFVARGWQLQVAHGGKLTPWADGQRLELPVHGIWARNPSFALDFVEILLNEVDDSVFRFRRDQSITRELRAAFTRAANGLPMLAPEIALLYKSGHPDVPENAADLAAAAPHLSREQRSWLNDALARSRPDHPWLDRLT